jgi:predicted transcriptional regulator of viral defense system
MHRGVYAVGHTRLTRHGHWTAAVLACGPGAALSHCCAAALLGLRGCSRTTIDVTAPGSAGRRRAGIRVHSAASVAAAEVTRVDGIPCTTVARTILDLGATTDERGIERMIDQADVMGIFDGRALAEALERAGRRRGAARGGRVLERFETALTRSELEERFLALSGNNARLRPARQRRAKAALHDGDHEHHQATQHRALCRSQQANRKPRARRTRH